MVNAPKNLLGFQEVTKENSTGEEEEGLFGPDSFCCIVKIYFLFETDDDPNEYTSYVGAEHRLDCKWHRISSFRV